MPVTVQSLVDRARRTLFDLTGVRWVDAELIDYFNDAQCQIVLFRPDAGSRMGVFACAPGTKQDLGAAVVNAQTGSTFAGSDVIQFMRAFRVFRHTGGSAPRPFDPALVVGGALRETNRLAMDTELPNWHAVNASQPNVDPQHYAFDLYDPKRIYLYPGVNRVVPQGSLSTTNFNIFIEVLYSAVPQTLAAGADIEQDGLGDQFVNAIYDWMLYRAYMKDTTYAGNIERAVSHMSSFAAGLGITLKNAMRASIPSGADRTLMRAPGEST